MKYAVPRMMIILLMMTLISFGTTEKSAAAVWMNSDIPDTAVIGKTYENIPITIYTNENHIMITKITVYWCNEMVEPIKKIREITNTNDLDLIDGWETYYFDLKVDKKMAQPDTTYYLLINCSMMKISGKNSSDVLENANSLDEIPENLLNPDFKKFYVKTTAVVGPVAMFSWKAKNGFWIFWQKEAEVNKTIAFKDESKRGYADIVNWTWDFGDGTIDYARNPTHRYVQKGHYNVTLSITDQDGKNDSHTIQITIGKANTSFRVVVLGGVMVVATGIVLMVIVTIKKMRKKNM